MRRLIGNSLVAILVMAIAPAALFTQESVPPEPQISAEIQEWMQEVQQIQAELGPVQDQALEQDTELQQQQQQVTAAMQETMAQLDPTLPQQVQRVEELQQEAQDAQEEGNAERIAELTREAQSIQERFQAVQAEALQHPEVAPQLEAFQTRLQERMVEIDPDAAAKIQRLEELERQLETTLRQPE